MLNILKCTDSPSTTEKYLLHMSVRPRLRNPALVDVALLSVSLSLVQVTERRLASTIKHDVMVKV